MRNFLLLLALFSCVAMTAQVTSITVEEYYTDDGSVTGYPVGYTTYRVFANCTNTNDVVSTVYGEVEYPMLMSITDGCMWNSNFGAEKGDDLNPVFCTIAPSTCYDSFFTIGRASSGDPGGAIFLVEDGSQPFSNEFGNAELCGESFVVNTQVGGAWFGLPGDANCFAGADLKILLAQVTTDGNVSGTWNLQCFPGWENPGDPFLEQTDFTFTSGGAIVVYGCTDPSSVNYNAAATEDNGSCLLCDIEFINVSSTAPVCAGNTNGSITVDITTTSDFFPKYSLNGGAYTFGVPPTQKTYGSLGNGTYTVYARDTKWDDAGFNPGGIYGTCEISTVVPFDVLPIVIASSTITNVSCNGAGDGMVVNAGATGGSGDLSYFLQYSPENTAVLDGNGDPITLASPNYNGLLPDCYRWFISDENACTGVSAQFCVTQPSALFLIVGSTVAATCSDSDNGSVLMTWGGGAGDVDWSVNNPDGPYVDGTNFITNVPAGPGIMYGMDTNGCIDDVPFTVSAPAAVNVSASSAEPSCFDGADGTINASATGGNNIFTYSLDNVTFGTGTFTGLAEGDYTVYAEDANGCAGQTTLTIDEPSPVTAATTPTDVTCNGDDDGCVAVAVSGGTAPYTINGGNLQQFCDLAPGTYTYDILDDNGCPYTIDETVGEPALLEASTSTTDVSCNNEGDGEIVVTPTGGTAPYEYSDNCGDNFQSSDTFDGLDGGTYCIVVEDDNGCQVSISTVTISEPEELDGSITTISGVDEDGGDIDATVSGGTTGYDYEWTGPNGFSASTEDLSGLDDAGTYTLTVTDANGCTWTDQVTITGINEMGQFISIGVSPNPTSGLFNLTINGLTHNAVRYQITDAQGRMVSERILNKNQQQVVEQIDISQVESGVYFLNLLIGDNVETFKVIKQ